MPWPQKYEKWKRERLATLGIPAGRVSEFDADVLRRLVAMYSGKKLNPRDSGAIPGDDRAGTDALIAALQAYRRDLDDRFRLAPTAENP